MIKPFKWWQKAVYSPLHLGYLATGSFMLGDKKMVICVYVDDKDDIDRCLDDGVFNFWRKIGAL